MDWYNITLQESRTARFRNYPDVGGDAIGGRSKTGYWAWLVHECQPSILKIFSVCSGHKLMSCDFDALPSPYKYRVCCVEELYLPNCSEYIIVVGLQVKGQRNLCSVALFSLTYKCIFRCIEVKANIACMSLINNRCRQNTIFEMCDGCLAIGTTEGSVILLDLKMEQILPIRLNLANEENFMVYIYTQAVVCNATTHPEEVLYRLPENLAFIVHSAVEINVTDLPCSITSLVEIEYVSGIGIGLQDGRLALCDLKRLNIAIKAQPSCSEQEIPIKRMCCMPVKNYDEMDSFYICVLHSNAEFLSAFLYAFVYQNRHVEVEENKITFTGFQGCFIRFQILLENVNTDIIGCQSDKEALIVMGWHSIQEKVNKVLLFDCNQWYKEGMPDTIHDFQKPTYLAGFLTNNTQAGLHLHFDFHSVGHFDSFHRNNEFGYPNSLKFYCELMLKDSYEFHAWEGVQERFLNFLRMQNASIFLDPQQFYDEVVRTSLFPKFCDLNKNSKPSKAAICEILMSVALENRCSNLLYDCAYSWAKNGNSSQDLSLFTLTDWIDKRANQMKEYCSNIWSGLDNHADDEYGRKELKSFIDQLRFLGDILSKVLHFCKSKIPTNVFHELTEKRSAIRLESDYQKLIYLLWNIGLGTNERPLKATFEKLTEFYARKRAFFNNLSNEFIIQKSTGTSRLLYIDSLLNNYNSFNYLCRFWPESVGKYPPLSLKGLLRIMLIPHLQTEQKCAVVLYFLLDLKACLGQEMDEALMSTYNNLKMSYKLSENLVKKIEVFWNLDHNFFQVAVEKFISCLRLQQIHKSETDLLMEALLTQDERQLALTVLNLSRTNISDMLHLKTLIANEQTVKAFEFARRLSKVDASNMKFLEIFFSSYIYASKFKSLRQFSLNEKEKELIEKILKRSKMPGTENGHFAYLLENSKSMEAGFQTGPNRFIDSSASEGIENYRHALTRVYKQSVIPIKNNVTTAYSRIRDKTNVREVDNISPMPFSCQLAKQNANNLLGGVSESAALSTHRVTTYSDEKGNYLDPINAPFLRKVFDKPFSRNVDNGPLCYPMTYVKAGKRKRELEEYSTSPAIQTTNAQEEKGNSPGSQYNSPQSGNFDYFNTYQVNSLSSVDSLTSEISAISLVGSNNETPFDVYETPRRSHSQKVTNLLETIEEESPLLSPVSQENPSIADESVESTPSPLNRCAAENVKGTPKSLKRFAPSDSQPRRSKRLASKIERNTYGGSNSNLKATNERASSVAHEPEMKVPTIAGRRKSQTRATSVPL